MTTFYVEIAGRKWAVPKWAMPFVLLLALPGIVVFVVAAVVAAVLMLPGLVLGALVGSRVR